jgi:cobalt/nickel transport system permease protein
MGQGHGHQLHYHGHSVVHRLPAHLKIVALLGFIVLVVLTPRQQFWAFGAYLALLAGPVTLSQVPVGYLARRMVVEAPFVVFAALLPFVATGPTVAVGPLALSQAGLLGAWGLLAKGTLGVLASLLLGATTEPRDVLAGLERLRLPHQLVQIMGFMMRYLEVVAGELHRMRIARESRGFQGRSVQAWPALASTAGALFIRSYERGERIHLAMLARGYQGRMPATQATAATGVQWAQAGVLPAGAALVLAAALVAGSAA